MSSAVALPHNWAVFVDNVLMGVEPTKAAKSLGYSSPARAAAEMLKHPQVRKALATAAEARLEYESVPLALDVVKEILSDRDPKARAVRAKLALGVLDRVRSKEDKSAQVGKPLHELSVSELGELLTRLQASTPGQGQMLNITPEQSPSANDKP